MWGNRLGWILAGVMLMAMIVTISTAYVVSSKRTPPTGFVADPANLAQLQLPIDPQTLLPPNQRDADARDQYDRAVADYNARPDQYAALAARFDMDRALALDGVAALLAAADCAKGTLFPGDMSDAVGYGTRPRLDALRHVGGVCARIGTEYASRKQYDQARRYLDAAFTLGYHLYAQRLSRMQLSSGLGLMAQAATLRRQIATAEQDKETAAKYGDFVTQYQQYYRDRIEPMERVITSVDPKVQSEHVGDVFVIVDQSQERTWRVEGVLKLGMYKYNTNTAGDRRAAIAKVKSLLSDPDPAIAAAAGTAKELTMEQYRMLGAK